MLKDNLAEVERFFSHGSLLEFKKKDIILHPDDYIGDVYFLHNGYVRIYHVSETGEELTLTILKPGDLFPITAMVKDMPNNYYIEAITQLSVYRVSKEQFLAFLKDNLEIFYKLTNNILTRFGDLLSRMEYLLLSHAKAKVASTLLICAHNFGEQQGSSVVLKLPLTHKDIATLAGITRETTCLEMKKLEKKGLISRLGRLFVVKNIKALEEESAAEYFLTY